jgi:hypothetical protein
MKNVYSPEYDKVRDWIRLARKNGKTWDEIRSTKVYENEEVFFRRITSEEWNAIVEALQEAEKQEIIIVPKDSIGTRRDPPTDPRSAWVLYKNHLLESGWNEDSIRELEISTETILNRLNLDEEGSIVKGMVVGHVQSGKTANMAALMAMAADWGWNLFIVLSGTIENLRKQTQARLFRDLSGKGRYGNLVWREIRHPSPHTDIGEKLHNLDLGIKSRERYFTVCLKNSRRLEDLIKWLQSDPHNLRNARIIVLDDEADQAGINTEDVWAQERSKINSLIVNLVEGRRPDGSEFHTKPACMNYIGYTATPYANFLNESWEESLYPRNFIHALKPSNEYIGARQIFGLEGTEENEGMNIIREVPKKDLEQIKNIHKNSRALLPPSLVDSLLWFLCAAAAMRRIGYKRKAISMLVHTSQKQIHHTNMAHAIKNWLEANRQESRMESLLKACKSVWQAETKNFGKEDFLAKMPDYPGNIGDYPSFEEIVPFIKQLIRRISHIHLNEDGELDYHDGIHVCIDNCSYNFSRDGDVYVRLAYPDPSRPDYPDPAPAFIVVGGSTLSRGLTIEGLVSTYFLRASNQADSLMQMGRWFGYRRGYELYPRIWMTENTRSKFVFLAKLEKDLRDDLRRFMEEGADPSVYGPRVRNSPDLSWLRITSRNRMQSAIEFDFSGTNAQTVVFHSDESILEKNIRTADLFLEGLGPGQPSFSGNSVVWRKVPFERIKEDFLRKMVFHPRANFFNQIDAFCDWYTLSAGEAGYTDWNVVVAGTKVSSAEKAWHVPGGMVGKVNRSRKDAAREDGSLNIGVLRNPNDLFEDLERGLPDLPTGSGAVPNEQIRKIRERAGLGKTPQLILYRIDKDSQPNSKDRKPLGVRHDIIGISIWVPTVEASKNLGRMLTVRITPDQIDTDDETGDADED